MEKNINSKSVMENIIDQFTKAIEHLSDWFAEYVLIGTIVLFSEFFGVDQQIVKVLTYVIFTDMITGVCKSIVVPELKFSGRTLIIGIISKISLLIIPGVVVITLREIFNTTDVSVIMMLVIKVMIAVELLSILYNGISIQKKRDVKSEDYISKMYEVFIKVLELWIENTLKKLKTKIGKK